MLPRKTKRECLQKKQEKILQYSCSNLSSKSREKYFFKHETRIKQTWLLLKQYYWKSINQNAFLSWRKNSVRKIKADTTQCVNVDIACMWCMHHYIGSIIITSASKMPPHLRKTRWLAAVLFCQAACYTHSSNTHTPTVTHTSRCLFWLLL